MDNRMGIETLLTQFNTLEMEEDLQSKYLEVINEFYSKGYTELPANYVADFICLYAEDGRKAVETELERIRNSCKSPESISLQNRVTWDILSLIDTIESNCLSMDDTIKLVRLMRGKPLIPLTGADDEWALLEGTEIEINKLFKPVIRNVGDNSTARNTEGRVFSEDGGITWFTMGGDTELNSSVPIKFPYTVPYCPVEVYLDGENGEVITDAKRVRELRNQATAEAEL